MPTAMAEDVAVTLMGRGSLAQLRENARLEATRLAVRAGTASDLQSVVQRAQQDAVVDAVIHKALNTMKGVGCVGTQPQRHMHNAQYVRGVHG